MPRQSLAPARLGWVDGCNSGFHDANNPEFHMDFYRDARAYESSTDYRRAWDAAFRECYEEGLRRGPTTGGDARG